MIEILQISSLGCSSGFGVIYFQIERNSRTDMPKIVWYKLKCSVSHPCCARVLEPWETGGEWAGGSWDKGWGRAHLHMFLVFKLHLMGPCAPLPLS